MLRAEGIAASWFPRPDGFLPPARFRSRRMPQPLETLPIQSQSLKSSFSPPSLPRVVSSGPPVGLRGNDSCYRLYSVKRLSIHPADLFSPLLPGGMVMGETPAAVGEDSCGQVRRTDRYQARRSCLIITAISINNRREEYQYVTSLCLGIRFPVYVCPPVCPTEPIALHYERGDPYGEGSEQPHRHR